jgi:hypothetical protein
MQSKYLGTKGSIGKKGIEEIEEGLPFSPGFVLSHRDLACRELLLLVLKHRNLLLLSANCLLGSNPLVVLRPRLRQLGL